MTPGWSRRTLPSDWAAAAQWRYQECLKEFNQREVETLIHGDFNGGNNMFGKNRESKRSDKNYDIYTLTCR